MVIEKGLFFSKIEESISLKFPFVIYRKPGDAIVKGIFQKDQTQHQFDENSKSGFVFAPFNKEATKLFIPHAEGNLFEANWQSTENLTESSLESTTDNEEFERYTALVSKAIEFINHSEVKKVVTSRKEIIQIEEFNLITSFDKMLGNYPNAMNYCWFHPASGLWMGATPEQLISLKNNTLETVSLAATRQYKGSMEVDWSQKEFEEQQLVTQFILDELKPFSDEVVATEPKTVRAGNVLHLNSKITCKIANRNCVFQLIEALHPTPAVCGLPRKNATDFLKLHEKYDRSFYAGYLGEFRMNDAVDLFVNLRCMKVESGTVSIFVGGGITSKSNPKSEWGETVLKSMTIKRVILG